MGARAREEIAPAQPEPLYPEVIDRPDRQLRPGFNDPEEFPEGVIPYVEIPGLARQATPEENRIDNEMWQLINLGGNPLGLLTFEQAVLKDPLRVEALIHQRLHAVWFNAIGVAPTTALPGGDIYRLRNQTLRSVHGRINAENLANSLNLNWQEWSSSYRQLVQMAASNEQARAALQRISQWMPEIVQAVREGMEICQRASKIAKTAEDKYGWVNMAEALLAEGSFIEASTTVPVRGSRPDPRGPAPRGPAGLVGGPVTATRAALQELPPPDSDWAAWSDTAALLRSADAMALAEVCDEHAEAFEDDVNMDAWTSVGLQIRSLIATETDARHRDILTMAYLKAARQNHSLPPV